MDRPHKRPRISIFEDGLSGAELDAARYNNDMTLKNRFELIFEKYAQDFTGIGDEIDMASGEIVVNNGHLENMETETDPGIDHLSSNFTSTGRSMLRAMTVTLNPDLPGPDDVLMSIETIAANATLSDDVSTDESEDTLGEHSESSRHARSKSSAGDTPNQNQNPRNLEPYDSESDSLFGGDCRRSVSVDSLFEVDSRIGIGSVPFEAVSPDLIDPLLHSVSNTANEDDIIARYGPYIGKEVLQLLHQRQDAHIEPAWRIPVRLDTGTAQWSTPRETTSPLVEASPKFGQSQSLWKAPKSKTKTPGATGSSNSLAREESVDPLQEDCSSEVYTEQRPQIYEDSHHTDIESEPKDDSIRNILLQTSTTGECPYCHINFSTKSGVMAHWDRYLRQPQKRISKDDPHDFEVMKTIRSTAKIRVRLPRLVVYDFRTLVELHEGAGMSFDEIAESKTLRTRKTGLQLQDVYNKHRTPPTWNDSTSQTREWTAAEEDTLRQLCNNPLITMATLRRGLKSRTELEIGNHLADVWLTQLGVSRGQRGSVIQRVSPVNITSESSISDQVKQEESEDELFGDS